MNGLSLAEKYFDAVGRPMLEREMGPLLDRVAAGLVGDGSECYGFDDNISRDHDWGPGFCIWLLMEDFEKYGKRLQNAYNRLPGSYEGYGPRKTSQWGGKRVGVFEITEFYQTFIGFDHVPGELDVWLMIPENSLAACTNGKVFIDGPGEFTDFRNKLLSFYPDDVRRKKIASRCMTIGQSGQYNLPRLLDRKEFYAANYALVKFVADAISLVFLLNRHYTPFYKWMHKAMKSLPILGASIHQQISFLVMEHDLEKKKAYIETISGMLIEELIRQELSDGTSAFITDHGPCVQDGILDHTLRRRNVWVG
ncbi:hypothetical protein DSCA_19410 [Desulfosarcina alkanivorans]|uniref:DUF4037 domain-containing protein n=1 Tax=Desulfosarcina alkanivorans TaxID=571177 RepID=A0A5K7YMC6_9BACT|nr:DUF4037 domain-containing protein [Desulfosarcina alkanivorans]BBO68011.1 hypothetical protein DSCA_19410 [Desulfosarcina alkanivorans]